MASLTSNHIEVMRMWQESLEPGRMSHEGVVKDIDDGKWYIFWWAGAGRLLCLSGADGRPFFADKSYFGSKYTVVIDKQHVD